MLIFLLARLTYCFIRSTFFYYYYYYRALSWNSWYAEDDKSPFTISARFAYAQNLYAHSYAFSLINRTGLEFDRCLKRTYMSALWPHVSVYVPRFQSRREASVLHFVWKRAMYILFRFSKSLLDTYLLSIFFYLSLYQTTIAYLKDNRCSTFIIL